MNSKFLCLNLIILLFTNHSYSHGPNIEASNFPQGINIQITGIPNAAATTDDGQCPEQYCKVGKAGPQGRHGQKGEKGDAAEVCECITNQQLLDKINNLETLLQALQSKTTNLERSLAIQTLKDCEEIQRHLPSMTAGVHSININGRATEVYCDLEDGEDRMWTVIQRRFDGSEDFFRGRDDYMAGFGSKDSEYWLGLDNIHALTRDGRYQLKIDIESWEGVKKFALYSEFIVGDKASDYRLTIGGYSGSAGDSLAYHNGQRFSTKDHDVDSYTSYDCGSVYKAGWWYKSCHYSNLNGPYLRGNERSDLASMAWYHFDDPPRYFSMKSVQMKLRKKA